MRTFGLSDAELVALAAGRPSAATLGDLRRAQLSRHLLQLRELETLPRWYAGATAGRDLADPMIALHTASALDARRTGSAPPPAPVASPRHLTATHDGLRLRVRLEDTDPLRARLGLTPTGRLGDEAVEAWQRHLDEAWRLLVDRHRPGAATLARVLSVIVPVEPDPGAGGISATSADAFGAVALSAPADATSLAVGLLHEAQHSLLNALRVLFDLVEPSAARGYSPWRDDPRPAFGILHGAYAYQAVTRFWRAETQAVTRSGHAETQAVTRSGRDEAAGQARTGDPRAPGGTPAGRARAGARGLLAEFEFARWRAAVVEAADGLLGGEALTAAGRRVAGALRDEVAGWRDEPVDPLVARLAAGANLEHRVRWRLRNLAVDPAAVDALARAWRAGAPPPAVPEPGLRPAPRRELGHSERLALTHRHLRALEGDHQNRPGSGVRPGDDAYLGGNYGTAADAYRKDLDRDGGGIDAWTGLALVAPEPALRDRPEIVHALWTGVGGDVRALARWLTPRGAALQGR